MYQSNVFYLHTGLDKFEFGEYVQNTLKFQPLPFIITAYNMQLCALQVTDRAFKHMNIHILCT